jgi:EmrB/QacA subfamily drug resistance transporter
MTITAPLVRVGTPAGRAVLLATMLGSSLAMLDATVVNVALPKLGRDLDANFSDLQWIVNAYTLTLASFILLAGALGDHYGRKRIFMLGVAWFATASALCAVAPTAELLSLARALQGLGGALLTPGSLAIIAATFHPDDRSRAVGSWSALGGVAGAVGPFLGGWLVEWNWRAVFLVNLPVAVMVLFVTARSVPESRDPAASPRLDIPGSVLGAAGLGLLTYGLIGAGERGFGAYVAVFCLLGLAMLAAFVGVERRSDHPLVPLDMFANRAFTGANLVTFAAYAALGVVFFLLVLDLQIVGGFSPIFGGAALLPVTVLMLLLSSRMGVLADRIGARPLMTAGPLVAAVGVLLTLRIDPEASYLFDVLPAVVVFGLGLSMLVAPLTATVLASAPAGQAGVASGVNNAVARAAGLLAVAVIPVVSGLAGADYTDPGEFGSGFRIAMMLCAGLLVVGGLLGWLLVPAGAMVRAPKPAPEVPEGAAPTPTPVVLDLAMCVHCGITGPQLHPDRASASTVS